METNRASVQYLAEVQTCAEAARQITHLNRQLLRIQLPAVFSILDYYYVFTAAIVLQLGQLVQEVNDEADFDRIIALSNHLSKIGDRGNEAAKDCARMVLEFGVVVSRLLSNQTPQATASRNPSGSMRETVALSALPGKLPDAAAQAMALSADQHLANTAQFVDPDASLHDRPALHHELYQWCHDNTF